MVKGVLIALALLAVLSEVVARASQKCKRDTKCPLIYTKEMQQEILDYHNNARSKANPTASNMEKIYWDETLAVQSVKLSMKCKFEHDTSKDRRFDGYINVGQNLWSGTRRPSGISPAIGWYSEVKHFTFGNKTNKVVGHYTQLMQAKAARIGCGGAYCPNRRLKYIVTCNYLKGQYDFTNPYTLGKPCASCPNKCKNNLCDCNGMVCKNGGKLDLNTCKCNCYFNFHGEVCQKVDCSKEWKYCSYYKSYCGLKFGFIPRARCPITCGLCYNG